VAAGAAAASQPSSPAAPAASVGQGGDESPGEKIFEFLVVYGCGGEWCGRCSLQRICCTSARSQHCAVRFKDPSIKQSAGFKLPFASVAAAITSNGAAAPVPFDGKVFHSLPLPIKTGLPVHINASVNVSSNRRSVCDEDDDKGAWNRGLFHGLVRVCYLNLLQKAAEMLMHPSVHSLLPWVAAAPWASHIQVSRSRVCGVAVLLVATHALCRSRCMTASHAYRV
jgi:hypothetical protein